MSDDGWVRGDSLGLDLPAHVDALRAGGPAFLTEAFRRSGVLGAHADVAAITDLREFRGGSTGRKALLSVDYSAAAGLPDELFVKFSRDFDDAARDRGRAQMEFEVRFALLSRTPGFPITVPGCLFADYHAATGTGILITERIAYGANGIEPHYDKCLDYRMPDPLGHYEAMLGALGRLAGSHKAGRLPAELVEHFPVDMQRLSVGERAPYTAEQLQRRVDRLAEFAVAHPNLLPEDIRDPKFLARLRDQVIRFPTSEAAIWRYLAEDPDYVALCHWNANVDNAWFWRHPDGHLDCGLLDWGCVGQMNLAMVLWGAMCSAETDMWNQHFEVLLDHFLAEFRAAGGPLLQVATVKRHLLLYVAVMGLAWLLDVPGYLLKLLPSSVPDRFDARIADDEQARSRLLMMTNFLNLWSRNDMVGVLDGI
ncbi:hypothetical protein [Mycolicibacterium holsaticum]|uniref:Aminoglycoside phosphotransferase domain-containing protein n=1 Tax=Mycolicibacterium holsaticum TaxID=152142 RepID=A0A1E3RMG4_9MYCO|nr:hypothetical protein [Mycolicibacterium holsaticum]ODQ90622.1 hypothetical protein BHQ17_17160 [Mycolicibacterium holsaticum]